MHRIKIPELPPIGKIVQSIIALIYRDIMIYDGRLYGGMAYSFLRPIIFTLLFVAGITFLRLTNYQFETGFIFYLLPFISIFFFLDIISKIGQIDEQLLELPRVTYFSIFVAQCFSRLITYIPLYSMCIFLIYLLGYEINILRVFNIIIQTFILGVSYFFLVSIIIFRNNVLFQIHSFFPRFYIFISAVFFTMSSIKGLSNSLEYFLLMNPIVHIIEYSRNSFDFYLYDAIDETYSYKIFLTVMPLSLLIYYFRIEYLYYGKKY